jgi:hypothetical protein
VFAVRTCPQQPDWPTASGNVWIDLKHITDIVLSLRVIDGVQGNGLWIVVDGDIDAPSQSLLQAGGC